MQEESFEVQYTQEGERLDKVLSEIYPDFSRSFFQKLIKNKQIQVNGAVQKASYPVHTEDLIRVTIPDAVETTIEPENIPLDILYEDDDVLIVNKPKGMVVHPSAGHYSGTLVNAIMYHCKDSLSGINGQIRPGIVHRIDMDTTGSLIVCKNDESHVNIAMIHNGIYQCPGIMSCRWMNDHPFGFVHNQNIIVFIQNVQRNVFWFNGRFDSIRNGDTYEIFCMYRITGLLHCPVYLNLYAKMMKVT